MKSRPKITLQLRVQEWRILLTYQHSLKNKRPSPLRISSLNLDQSQVFPMILFNVSLDKQQKRSYLLPFLKNHTHSTTLVCFLYTTSFRRLLRIQINTRIYNDKYNKREHENGQIYFWRSYTCFLVQLYIWEFTRSLKSRCIGIQISIEALYIRFQTTYHSAVFSKSSGIVISLALRVTKTTDITYLLIRSGGIS